MPLKRQQKPKLHATKKTRHLYGTSVKSDIFGNLIGTVEICLLLLSEMISEFLERQRLK